MNNCFSKNLKYLLKKHNISKTYVANKIGVHQSTITRWETGLMGATVKNAQNLAVLFEVSLSDLLTKDLSKN